MYGFAAFLIQCYLCAPPYNASQCWLLYEIQFSLYATSRSKLMSLGMDMPTNETSGRRSLATNTGGTLKLSTVKPTELVNLGILGNNEGSQVQVEMYG